MSANSYRYTRPQFWGKLTEDQVREIVWWLRRSRSKSALARIYKVSRQTIWNIETSEAVQTGQIQEKQPEDFSLTDPIYRV